MQLIRLVNSALAFLLELVMFGALAFIGSRMGQNAWLKVLFAIVLPLIAIFLWAIFAAPRSNQRLAINQRVFFELALYFITSALLYQTGYKLQAIFFFIIVLASELVAYLFDYGDN